MRHLRNLMSLPLYTIESVPRYNVLACADPQQHGGECTLEDGNTMYSELPC